MGWDWTGLEQDILPPGQLVAAVWEHTYKSHIWTSGWPATQVLPHLDWCLQGLKLVWVPLCSILKSSHTESSSGYHLVSFES